MNALPEKSFDAEVLRQVCMALDVPCELMKLRLSYSLAHAEQIRFWSEKLSGSQPSEVHHG